LGAFGYRARSDSDLKPSKWLTLTIVSAVAFAAFSAVHLIDDFLFDVPLEFHLSVPFTLLLALAYMAALVGLVAAAAGRSSTGYLGLAIAGLLIALAQLLKSAPEILQPGPWHAGLASELAAIGLGASAAATLVASLLAWRSSSRPPGAVPQ
jgi:uncharacterized oligopeptide transporter (OPT) family protein